MFRRSRVAVGFAVLGMCGFALVFAGFCTGWVTWRRPTLPLVCSTIGAEGFHGRVRDGIGCWDPRYNHQITEPVHRCTAVPFAGYARELSH